MGRVIGHSENATLLLVRILLITHKKSRVRYGEDTLAKAHCI